MAAYVHSAEQNHALDEEAYTPLSQECGLRKEDGHHRKLYPFHMHGAGGIAGGAGVGLCGANLGTRYDNYHHDHLSYDHQPT